MTQPHVKTMPLSAAMMDGQTPAIFFGRTLPARQPPGKFYVIGRPYIGKKTPAGSLVLFHHAGAIVALARLPPSWYRPNDDPTGRPNAVAVYLFDDIRILHTPLGVADLPLAWQAKWACGRFDQYPRTLDPAEEAVFLAVAF